MSLIWNNKISVSYFGEAEDPVVGVTVNGLPKGEYIDTEELLKFFRRLSSKSMGDERKIILPRIMSGLRNNRTTGGSICAIFQNQKPVLEEKIADAQNFRYGHADYTGAVCSRGYCDAEKNTLTAERFTAPLCLAGAICAQILERRGIYTGGHIAMIHNIKDNPYDPVNITRDGVLSIRFKDFPVINDRRGWLMLNDIAMAREAGESLGGIVECASVNVPSGVGSSVFNGLANNIAQLIFSIPDVVGVEFGAGFSAAGMVGSQYSDSSYMTENGYSLTKTNTHGGMVSGVSTGMPITVNVVFRPVGKDSDVCCTVPKSVVYVEAAVNIALLSAMLDYPNFC